jgi:hypothetical protein
MAKRVPERVSTQIRKVDPVGGDMMRLYFAVERDGAWDDDPLRQDNPPGQVQRPAGF